MSIFSLASNYKNNKFLNNKKLSYSECKTKIKSIIFQIEFNYFKLNSYRLIKFSYYNQQVLSESISTPTKQENIPIRNVLNKPYFYARINLQSKISLKYFGHG